MGIPKLSSYAFPCKRPLRLPFSSHFYLSNLRLLSELGLPFYHICNHLLRWYSLLHSGRLDSLRVMFLTLRFHFKGFFVEDCVYLHHGRSAHAGYVLSLVAYVLHACKLCCLVRVSCLLLFRYMVSFTGCVSACSVHVSYLTFRSAICFLLSHTPRHPACRLL